ncbi:MAG: protein-export chaperone SecB [Pseudomonadota bacterium]
MTDNTQNSGASNGAEAPPRELGLHKTYIKDLSFESPAAPEIFRQAEFRPVTGVNLRTSHAEIEEGVYEVTITITVDAKVEDETAFLVELEQSGIFIIRGYSDEERRIILGTWCPNTIFPFAREAIASAVQRGGFPDLLIQPVDFDTLFRKSMERQQQEQEAQSA